MALTPFPNDEQLAGRWEELGVGAPTIIGLAMLCARRLAQSEPVADPVLTIEARALLYAARERGLMEIKAVNTAFESPERLLAVHVELEPERGIVFRSRTDPRWTVRFLDAFRQLCIAGLVLHHLYREFSLSEYGFKFAATIDPLEVQALVDEALEYG